MEKNKINVVIFDEDEPSIKDHRESRTVQSSKHVTPSNNHQLDVIQQEISYLTDKIRSLEQQTENITHLKNQSNTNIKNSQLPNLPSPDHSKEILFVIQKKIQIIVRQTKQLVDKLGQTFEKKLQSKLTKKYDEYGISKIKENYTSQIKKIEEGYQKQIERVNKQFKQSEKQMLAKVHAVEQQLLNRINQFDIKEKEYIDWIHHLEIQLQDKQKQQNTQPQHQLQTQYQSVPQQPLQQLTQHQQQQSKSKKMIEITHAQPPERTLMKQMSQNSSIITGDQNSSTLIAPKSTIHNQNSRVQRKHRIFDPANKNQSSISPNNKCISPNNTKVISPISNQPQQNMQSSKAINPLTKPRLTQNPPAPLKQQMSVAGRMTEPLNNNTADVQSSPWKAIDKSIEKSYVQPTRRNHIVKDVNEDEFYKDLPKASQGWEKFQDYEENGSSSSDSEEQDVVFYRNEDKKEQFGQKYKQPKWRTQQQSRPLSNVFGESKKEPMQRPEQKVFSPFDLS